MSKERDGQLLLNMEDVFDPQKVIEAHKKQISEGKTMDIKKVFLT